MLCTKCRKVDVRVYSRSGLCPKCKADEFTTFNQSSPKEETDDLVVWLDDVTGETSQEDVYRKLIEEAAHFLINYSIVLRIEGNTKGKEAISDWLKKAGEISGK